MRYKHHCRSCGNIVCHSCSPDIAQIHELSGLGKQRVCKQCYWGQDPVYVTHTSAGSNYEDGYESLAALTDGVDHLTLYTPVGNSAISKLFPQLENNNVDLLKQGNEGWSSVDLISLEESLNIKRLSDLSSKDDAIEQLEREKGQFQVEKDKMQRNHEEEKERLQLEIQEQLRIQHQKEKEMLQLELEKEKDRLRQELEKERMERARL